MADLEKIVEDLSTLTVMEAAELSKLLEEKWGVSAAAVAVAAPGAAAAGGGDAAEAKDSFDVVLAAVGDSKLASRRNAASCPGSYQAKNRCPKPAGRP